MAVRRQKVQAECDPLSLLISQSPSSHELEKDDDENEEVIPVIKNKKVNTLLNTLAPEKPIEYEPPPPAPEQPKIHDIQKPVKVVIEEPPPPVVAPPASKPIPAPASKISQQLPPKQENPIVKAPSAPSSVFEAEEDIFLKKTSGGDADDIFGAKGGELSELKFISPKEKLTSTKLDDNDSEDDEKVFLFFCIV